MIRSVPDPAAAAAAALADALAAALAAGAGPVGLVLSGGRTPGRVLPPLLAQDLDWGRVRVMAGDERLVPPGHPDSTEALIRALFSAAGRPLSYHGTGPDPAPAAALDHWRQGWAMMPPVAAAFLGLGPDGHVASLFPGRPEAANPTLTSAFVPETPPHAHARLTLGPAALGALPCIVLVAEGAEKRAVLARAMAPDADPAALPLAWIARLPQTSVFQDRP